MIVEAETVNVALPPGLIVVGDARTLIFGVATGLGEGVIVAVGIGVEVGVTVAVAVAVAVGVGVGNGVPDGEIWICATNGSGSPVRVSIQTGIAGTAEVLASAIP